MKLFEKTQIANLPILSSFVLSLVNFEISCLPQLFPLTFIQDKMNWKVSSDSFSSLFFPTANSDFKVVHFFKLLIFKLAVSDKAKRFKINSSFLKPIISLADQIYATQNLRFFQVEFLRACCFTILSFEKICDALQDSKIESFILMSVNKIVQSYRRKPETYFELVAATLNSLSFSVSSSFEKDSVRQCYYKVSLVFFRMHSENMVNKNQLASKTVSLRETECFCEILLQQANQLYNFDVFYSNEETFLRSSLCKFASDLVFQVLEEYNLMISLPFMETSLGGEFELGTTKSVIFRQERRVEFFTYLIYLQRLSVTRKSIDLNVFLQGQISGNFKLKTLSEYISKHRVDNGSAYLRVN